MDAEHLPFAVVVGIDVGKADHHAVALDAQGQRLLDRGLPNDETKLRTLLTELQRQGPVLVVVDQPASIGALSVAVAQALGLTVAYLPGLTMRRLAAAFPGEAKTDARDALVIAESARALPQALRTLALPEATLADLRLLCGYDDDLKQQITATSNRLRGLLTQLHRPEGTRPGAGPGATAGPSGGARPAAAIPHPPGVGRPQPAPAGHPAQGQGPPDRAPVGR